MDEIPRTFHVSHVGGGIPSVEVAQSIAMDVFRYGLWGHGYTDPEGTVRRADVTLSHEPDGSIWIWIAGWAAPAAVLTEEDRCPLCRRARRA